MPVTARFLAHYRRLAWFILVGTSAAGVHWGVVFGLVSHSGWHPLVANVFGWLVAFSVSFAGHHRLTFRDHAAPVGASLRRFFLVSAAGFAANQAAYAALLRWSPLRYDVALALVLVGVAAATYLLSRHWAFRRSQAH
jgi:putative flippase GtrA